MNDTLQLKNNLITRIRTSEDINLLKALQTILDNSEQSLVELNEQQIKSIEISREQIEKGEYKKHEIVISELKEWLEKK